MGKGVSLLRFSLAVIVCLTGSATLANEKALSEELPSEQFINQAQNDERIKFTIEERLRTDGRMDWEVLDVEVSQGHITLFGEVGEIEVAVTVDQHQPPVPVPCSFST